jgi:hypothetical protein
VLEIWRRAPAPHGVAGRGRLQLERDASLALPDTPSSLVWLAGLAAPALVAGCAGRGALVFAKVGNDMHDIFLLLLFLKVIDCTVCWAGSLPIDKGWKRKAERLALLDSAASMGASSYHFRTCLLLSLSSVRLLATSLPSVGCKLLLLSPRACPTQSQCAGAMPCATLVFLVFSTGGRTITFIFPYV